MVTLEMVAEVARGAETPCTSLRASASNARERHTYRWTASAGEEGQCDVFRAQGLPHRWQGFGHLYKHKPAVDPQREDSVRLRRLNHAANEVAIRRRAGDNVPVCPPQGVWHFEFDLVEAEAWGRRASPHAAPERPVKVCPRTCTPASLTSMTTPSTSGR